LKTVLEALFNPVSASEMMSFTESNPRARSERRKLVLTLIQNASFSLSPTSKSRTPRRPSEATPTATTIAWEMTRDLQ
jgi:hypothetical protein